MRHNKFRDKDDNFCSHSRRLSFPAVWKKCLTALKVSEIILISNTLKTFFMTQGEFSFRICVDLWALFTGGSVNKVGRIWQDRCTSALNFTDVQRFSVEVFRLFRELLGNQFTAFWGFFNYFTKYLSQQRPSQLSITQSCWALSRKRCAHYRNFGDWRRFGIGNTR